MTNLIDKLERADGPDRELDAEIALALEFPNWRTEKRWKRTNGWATPDRPTSIYSLYTPDGFGGCKKAPAYTASIDAAMTLGRDDWERADMMLTAMGVLGNPDYMKAGTWLKILPIHLCIAAYRAGRLIVKDEAHD